MTTTTLKLNPSAPLECNKEIKQSFKKKLNDVNMLDNSALNIKETITYFKDKDIKSKKKFKKKNVNQIDKIYWYICNHCHYI